LRKSTANLRESWVVVDERPVHFWHSNRPYPAQAPTIIHLHGFGISGRYLLPAADLLAEGFQTYVPNLPGYGRSIHPEKVLSIPELGQSVISFMNDQGVEKATLIGNSMGCITAIEAAHVAPERIERMVLVSPAGGPNNRPIFKGLAQLALDGLREPPGMFLIAVPDYLRFGFINAARLFWAMIHYPTVEHFKSTSTPTLVVLGERDPLVSEARIDGGTVENANIDIVRIDGAAHAINYSHPEKLAHLVRQFMAGQPLSDDPQSDGRAVILRQHDGGPT
jgi:pimeloyl-ACP methyl ester carboxylesterase